MVRRLMIFGVGLGELPASTLAQQTSSRCRRIAPSLKQVVSIAMTKGRFADIAGKPRQGDFHATDLALPGWKDCSLYGASTYTCDSAEVDTAEQAEAAQAAILQEIKTCLGEGWSEAAGRSSPSYVVLHQRPAPGLDHAEHGCNRRQELHVVHLILFIRRR